MTTTREVAGMTLAPGLYRHIKSGALYTVLGLVRHHETGKPMVLYYSHGHGTLSTRPLHGFATSRCSDPDGFAERFELLNEPRRAPDPESPGVSAVVLWSNETLLRNFAMFDAALRGVGKPQVEGPVELMTASEEDDDDDDSRCGCQDD